MASVATDTTQDFAGGTGFSQTITTILRKLVEYVMQVRLVLCIKSVKGEVVRNTVTRAGRRHPSFTLQEYLRTFIFQYEIRFLQLNNTSDNEIQRNKSFFLFSFSL